MPIYPRSIFRYVFSPRKVQDNRLYIQSVSVAFLIEILIEFFSQLGLRLRARLRFRIRKIAIAHSLDTHSGQS